MKVVILLQGQSAQNVRMNMTRQPTNKQEKTNTGPLTNPAVPTYYMYRMYGIKN